MNCEHSPLEVFRYCPKCGSPGFTPDTEKSLKCESCGFRYFINMSASVAAIIRNKKNEVLFTLRKHNPAAGMLDLPGGFVDLGETAEEALVREIKEELNLNINKLDYVGTFTNKYIYGEFEYQTLDLVFNCIVDSFSELQVADDVSGYVFRDPASVDTSEIGLDSIKKIVDYIH
ncbi:MAG: NUDIX domain-containing protein [Bacteroidales bacterium]|nr:NUDIX domain-containing protein [Bacteroidales bacterium]